MSNLRAASCSEHLVLELIPSHSSMYLMSPLCHGASRWSYGSTGVEGSPMSPLKAWLRSRRGATTQVRSFFSTSMHAGFVTPLHSSCSSSPAAQQGPPDSADILALTIPKLWRCFGFTVTNAGWKCSLHSTSCSLLYTHSPALCNSPSVLAHPFGGHTVNPFESKYRSKYRF